MTKKIKNAWEKYDEAGIKEIFDFCEGYRNYISICKTERECVNEAIRMAEEKGFRNLEEIIKNSQTLKAGDKVYANNKGKSLALFIIGDKPIEEGLKSTLLTSIPYSALTQSKPCLSIRSTIS